MSLEVREVGGVRFGPKTSNPRKGTEIEHIESIILHNEPKSEDL